MLRLPAARSRAMRPGPRELHMVGVPDTFMADSTSGLTTVNKATHVATARAMHGARLGRVATDNPGRGLKSPLLAQK